MIPSKLQREAIARRERTNRTAACARLLIRNHLTIRAAPCSRSPCCKGGQKPLRHRSGRLPFVSRIAGIAVQNPALALATQYQARTASASECIDRVAQSAGKTRLAPEWRGTVRSRLNTRFPSRRVDEIRVEGNAATISGHYERLIAAVVKEEEDTAQVPSLMPDRRVEPFRSTRCAGAPTCTAGRPHPCRTRWRAARTVPGPTRKAP